MSNFMILIITISVLLFLLIFICLGVLAYDCIYEYVCEQLDHCNYFGEDYYV